MRDDEEACLAKEARQKAEEHKRARLTVEEVVRLALEARQRAEEYEHMRLEAEEEAHLVEE